MKYAIYLLVLSLFLSACANEQGATCQKTTSSFKVKGRTPALKHHEVGFDPNYQFIVANQSIYRVLNEAGILVEKDMFTAKNARTIAADKCSDCLSQVDGDTIYYCDETDLKIYLKDTYLKTIPLTKGYYFTRNNGAFRKIDASRFAALVSPVATIWNEAHYHLQRLDSSSIAVINVATDSVQICAKWPKEFPYTQRKKLFNGLEFNNDFALSNDSLFVVYPFSRAIYYINLEKNTDSLQLLVRFPECDIFPSKKLEELTADEPWESDGSGRFISTTSLFDALYYLGDGRFLVKYIKGMDFKEGPMSQLERDWYFLEINQHTGEMIVHDMKGYEYYNTIRDKNNFHLLTKNNAETYYTIINF